MMRLAELDCSRHKDNLANKCSSANPAIDAIRFDGQHRFALRPFVVAHQKTGPTCLVRHLFGRVT